MVTRVYIIKHDCVCVCARIRYGKCNFRRINFGLFAIEISHPFSILCDMQTTEGMLPAVADSQVEIIGRRVFCPRDMVRWERSEAFADLTAFVERINNVAAAVTGNGNGTTGNVDRVVEMLGHVEGWMVEPTGNGRPAVREFVEFHRALRTQGHVLLVQWYGRPCDHRTVELPAYLAMSFGDPATGTFGPEHELSFCMYLVALFKLRRLTCEDEPYVVTVLMARYLPN